MKTLCVMCGCSGSDRPTISKMIFDLNDNWELVSTDAIITSVYGNSGCQRHEPLVLPIAYYIIADLLVDPNIKGVVFDATNLTPEIRSEIFKQLGNFDNVEITAVNVIRDLEDCLLMQRCSDRKVSEGEIRAQYNKFKPATSAEGFSKIVNKYT